MDLVGDPRKLQLGRGEVDREEKGGGHWSKLSRKLPYGHLELNSPGGLGEIVLCLRADNTFASLIAGSSVSSGVLTSE